MIVHDKETGRRHHHPRVSQDEDRLLPANDERRGVVFRTYNHLLLSLSLPSSSSGVHSSYKPSLILISGADIKVSRAKLSDRLTARRHDSHEAQDVVCERHETQEESKGGGTAITSFSCLVSRHP